MRIADTETWGILPTSAVLAAILFIVYSPAVNGAFIWDDSGHVTNVALRSLHGLWRIWFELGATQQYYPLLHSAFWIEHRLWGDSPVGYHLINIFWHATAVGLVLCILRELKVPGAVLAVSIFALHPVQVESVAWITEQKNTLSAVFYLTAMLTYLRFEQKRRTLLYFLASGFFCLGLLTKTVVATLPGALLLIRWWQRGELSWRDIAPLIPWLILGAAAGLFTAWVELKLIGAQGAAFELTFLQRSLLAGRVIWFYLAKLFWPRELIFVYPRWQIDPAAWLQYLFPLGVLLIVAGSWLVRKRWRAPLAGLLFFIGALFPVLGFLNVYPFIYSFVADHFQYLANLGIIVTVAAGSTILITRLPVNLRWLGQLSCIVLLGVLGLLTWRESRKYSDIETLYRTTIASNPNCWMCYNNLGVFLAEAGLQQAARVEFQHVLEIKPDHAEAHYNLGLISASHGDVNAAIVHYRQALNIDPRYTEAHNNLGSALFNIGKSAEAIEHFEQALAINPRHAKAHRNLGTVLLSLGQTEQAVAHFRQAVEINPGYADAHEALARALLSQGNKEEAAKHLEESIRIVRASRQRN